MGMLLQNIKPAAGEDSSPAAGQRFNDLFFSRGEILGFDEVNRNLQHHQRVGGVDLVVAVDVGRQLLVVGQGCLLYTSKPPWRRG